MSEDAKPVRWWNRPLSPYQLCIAILLILLFFVVPFMFPAAPAMFQIAWAMLTGWASHAFRVMPQFIGKWQSVALPLASVLLAWWIGHAFFRWYLNASGSRIAGLWTAPRSGALLALMLLGAAAAVSISGVAHQAMWLGQTKWIETRGGRPITLASISARDLALVMAYYDSETGRLPASLDEVLEYSIENNIFHHPWRIFAGHDRSLYTPMLTQPGAVLGDLRENAIVLITNPVDGNHVVVLAGGTTILLSPQELDEIIGRGDWLYHESP